MCYNKLLLIIIFEVLKMYILPAIDLKNGEVVRLVEGDYNNKKNIREYGLKSLYSLIL